MTELKEVDFAAVEERIMSRYSRPQRYSYALAREALGIKPDEEMTPEQRRAAKALLFGILYGDRE